MKVPEFPSKASSDELANGLSRERLAALNDMVRIFKHVHRITKASDAEERVRKTIAQASRLFDRSEVTVQDSYRSLASAAKWESRTIRDLLLHQPTRRGRPPVVGGLDTRVSARVSMETRDAYERAVAAYVGDHEGATASDFLQAAADFYLDRRKFPSARKSV